MGEGGTRGRTPCDAIVEPLRGQAEKRGRDERDHVRHGCERARRVLAVLVAEELAGGSDRERAAGCAWASARTLPCPARVERTVRGQADEGQERAVKGDAHDDEDPERARQLDDVAQRKLVADLGANYPFATRKPQAHVNPSGVGLASAGGSRQVGSPIVWVGQCKALYL